MKHIGVSARSVPANPLVAAVADPPSDDGMTVKELAESAGLSLSTTKDRIQALIRGGRLTVGHRIIRDVMGRRISVPVYRIKDGA